MKTSTWWSRIAGPVGLLAGASGALAVLAILGPSHAVPVECPFLAMTGFACPLCGGTRAAYALATGDVGDAFTYNPVAAVAVPAVLALIGWWIGRSVRGKSSALRSLTPRATALAGVALVAFAVARNLPGWDAYLGP